MSQENATEVEGSGTTASLRLLGPLVTGQLLRVDLWTGSGFVNAGHPSPWRLHGGRLEHITPEIDPPFGAPLPHPHRVQPLLHAQQGVRLHDDATVVCLDWRGTQDQGRPVVRGGSAHGVGCSAPPGGGSSSRTPDRRPRAGAIRATPLSSPSGALPSTPFEVGDVVCDRIGG